MASSCMMTFLSVFSLPIFKGELAVKVWGRVKQYLGPPEETHGTTPKNPVVIQLKRTLGSEIRFNQHMLVDNPLLQSLKN